MEKLYTVSKNKMGADCGSDHELLIAKFRLKLKKVGKTTRLFRYDLNQIPYDPTTPRAARTSRPDYPVLLNSVQTCIALMFFTIFFLHGLAY